MSSGQELIDRSSPVPLYHQLVAQLRAEIERGTYGVGDLLPSEGEICERYGVSRSVVRQSLTNLAHAGLIRTERGRGSFVAERKLQERFVQRTTGLYDDLREMGHRVRTAVVQQEVATLPLQVQEFFGTERGIQIDRIRSVNDRHLAYIRTYLPEDRCRGIESADLEDRSLYGYLQDRYGLRPATGRRTVEAVGVDDPVATHLRIDVGTPILLLRSSSWDEDGRPLEWFDAWHRADRTIFEIEIMPGLSEYSVNSVVVDPALGGTPPTRQLATVPGNGETAPPVEPAGNADSLVVRSLRRHRSLVTLRATRIERPSAIVRELIEQGFPVIALPPGLVREVVAEIASDRPDGVLIGADTVLDVPTAQALMAHGTDFIVTPVGTDDVIAAIPNEQTLLSGYSPAEIGHAWRTTRNGVVVYPAPAGGPTYLRSLAAMFRDVPLIAAGDVGSSGVTSCIDAGAIAVDVGEIICPREVLEAGDVEAIGRVAARIRAELDEG